MRNGNENRGREHDDSSKHLLKLSAQKGIKKAPFPARQPCYPVPEWNLGQKLCVPSFRMVCYYQTILFIIISFFIL